VPRRYVTARLIEQTRETVISLPRPTLADKQARHSPYAQIFWDHFKAIHRDHVRGDIWEDIIPRYFRKPLPSKRTVQRLYQAALEHTTGVPRKRKVAPKKAAPRKKTSKPATRKKSAK
jgi:hypothetical protein